MKTLTKALSLFNRTEKLIALGMVLTVVIMAVLFPEQLMK